MTRLEKNESKIILFSGSKGGCGCSFAASCVSAYLARKTNKNVLLLDLNIGKKDSRIIFNIEGKDVRDLGDIEDIVSELDTSILRRLVVNFDSSLNLILPSLKIEKNKIFCGKNLEVLLDVLGNNFDIICIDFPYHLLVHNELDLIEYVDKFIIVSLADFISVSNLNLLADSICCDDFSYSLDVVINKFNIKPSISPSRLSSILNYPVKAFIPYDRDIELLFLNKGPFPIFNYNLRIIRSIADLSERVYEDLNYGA